MFAILIGTCWFLYANDQTSKHRLKLLNIIFYTKNSGSFGVDEELLDEYKMVSYDDHMMAIMLFRNWHNLYPRLGKLVE